jgi:F-type H+-transporting ATPase subunit epsilon
MATMKLSIVTPEQVAYQSEEVESVNVRTIDGNRGILANHEPLITGLDIGVIEIEERDGEDIFSAGQGYMEVKPDEVVILVDSAEHSEEINVERALQAKKEAEELGELAVMMDVKGGKSNPDTMRIGSTMQFLVFRELEKLTAQQLLFQRSATFRDTNGVTKLNEGLWHQLRRGKLIKYARPNGITKNHIKEAVQYVFRNNPHIQPINRRIRFKCGTAAYENVIDIFQDEVRAQLTNLGNQGLMGADMVLPSNPVSGGLMDLKLSPVRFTQVYLPAIGNVELELDTNLDYNIMDTDRMSRGMHQYQRAHSTHSMVIWDVEDQNFSNNDKLPEGAEVVEGGSSSSNIYLVKPKDMLMHWGYTNGRYSIQKAGDIVSSHKQIGQEFWAWNSVAVFVRDITKFVMIELDRAAMKGTN